MKFLKDYFYYTRSERNGSLLLITVCLLILVAPIFFQYIPRNLSVDATELEEAVKKLEAPVYAEAEKKEEFLLQPFDPNTAKLSDLNALGIPFATAQTLIKYRQKVGPFQEKEDLQKIYNLTPAEYKRLESYIMIKEPQKAILTEHHNKKPQRFNFNPNTVSKRELEQLGFPSWLADRVIKYRNSGGHFNTPEDLRKIYGLEEKFYKTLLPLVRIPKKESDHKVEILKEKAPLILDINKATLEEWKALSGIGDYRARKIIQFREKLGGFADIQTLSKTYGIPDSVFSNIRPQLRSSPVFRKLAINMLTLDEFKAHPFISYKQARLIVNYREHHGPFREVSELLEIKALSKDWIEKIKPYLQFDER